MFGQPRQGPLCPGKSAVDKVRKVPRKGIDVHASVSGVRYFPMPNSFP